MIWFPLTWFPDLVIDFFSVGRKNTTNVQTGHEILVSSELADSPA